MITVWIHQSVQMYNEVPHLSLIDRPLRGLPPSGFSICETRENADNIQTVQVAKTHALQIFELTAKNEV